MSFYYCYAIFFFNIQPDLLKQLLEYRHILLPTLYLYKFTVFHWPETF